MRSVDIEGELHWAGRERLIVLLEGLGLLAATCASVWWFNNLIPLRFVRLLWFIPNFIVGVSGLSCIVVSLIPRQTLWLMDILRAFWPE